MTDARGMASLTGVLPPFVPFAQAFAAVTTAALTGSLYYVAASPKDPTYVVAPVLQSGSGRHDLKKLFAAWYERRQMKKIYSPLLEALLALYLGFEWIQVEFDNGKPVGVTFEGETAKCKKGVVCDPSYLPDKVKKVGKVARAICIMNHPIPDTNDSHFAQIILLQKQLGRSSFAIDYDVTGGLGCLVDLVC